ncbi:MAG: hypothetical protein PHT53_00575 [Candidatus Omnitrophica bacterium]|nr:hypothetical protein [Candidatus Omnitrophota bacterium]
MFTKAIFSIFMVIMPFYVFSQPVTANPDENTASPKVSIEEQKTSEDGKKSLKDMVVTEPQFPSITTTEEKEKVLTAEENEQKK